jgi:hypothetical protein
VSKSAFGRQLRVAKRQILLQTALQTAFCSQGKADGGDLLLLVWSAEMRFQFKRAIMMKALVANNTRRSGRRRHWAV